MKLIPLINSQYHVMVDDDSFERVAFLEWKINPAGYAYNSRALYMHQLIMMPYDQVLVVHHINKNKLDNRKSNLQLLTASDHASLHHLHNYNLNTYLPSEKELRDFAKFINDDEEKWNTAKRKYII